MNLPTTLLAADISGKRRRISHSVARLATLTLLGAGTFSASAQDSGSGTGTRTLEEITVTAQRREQTLQSVPIAITALTAGSMDSSGVSDLADLPLVTPGLVMTVSRGSTTPYLRGVGTQAGDPGGTSSVATYVDGVYYSAPMNGLFSFNNIERIEVIKGPQGTLFGQSATGGLIHVITRDPKSEASGDVKVSYGNYDTSSLSLYQTVGVTDTLATDVSFWGTYQGEGYGKNLYRGNDVNYRREYAVRNKWLWTPGDATRVTVALDYGANSNDAGQTRTLLAGTFGAGRTPARGDGYDTQANLDNDVDASSYTGSLRVEQDFGDLKFTSTSAYRHVESSADFDQDTTPLGAPAGVDAIFREDTDSFQQEFLLNGTNGRLDWTAGVFYFHDDASITPVSFIAGPVGLRGWRIDRYATQKLDSLAGFAQGTFSLTDQTRLTAGLRYTKDRRFVEGVDDVVIATVDGPIAGRAPVPPGFPVVLSPFVKVKQHTDFEEPTWRLALDHNFTSDLLAYASYSRGYKTGQYNVVSYTNAAAKPEVLDSYEVGFKADLLGHTLRVNGAAFQYNYKDIQLLRVIAGGAQVVNAAESRIRGLDLETIWFATDNLQFSGSLSILDGKYTDYPDAEAFVPNPAGGNTRVANYDATGNKTLNTPDWTLNLTANYSVPVAIGTLNFNVTYLHSDDINYSVDTVGVQDAYDVVNARIGLTSGDKRWGVAVYGRNLTDEEYWLSMSRSTLGDLISLNPPRTYGLELSYSWANQ